MNDDYVSFSQIKHSVCCSLIKQIILFCLVISIESLCAHTKSHALPIFIDNIFMTFPNTFSVREGKVSALPPT